MTRLRDQTLSAEAKQELARLTVTALYAGIDTALLEEILAVGLRYKAESDRDEVLYLNAALGAEIERRKGNQP